MKETFVELFLYLFASVIGVFALFIILKCLGFL